ncbi:MAG: hypothetical protein IAF38_02145, partial [Bacteroidia bacterium]|nr:hypothetical protein [Bacteroidia bacterium]
MKSKKVIGVIFILFLFVVSLMRAQVTNPSVPCMCDPLAPPASGESVVTVNNLTQLQNEIISATGPKTIYIASGVYDGTLAPYASSGVVCEIMKSDITIRSVTGNPNDVVIDCGAFDTSRIAVPPYGDYPGVLYGFVIADWLYGVSDTLRNITIADITVRDARNHNISIEGDYHPQNIKIHNVVLINAGQQLIKVNSNNLNNPTAVSNGIIECSTLKFETTTCLSFHTQNGWYTNGVDIHAGREWIIRYNRFENIITHPAGIALPAGAAILIWSNSVNCITEGNEIINCDRGIEYGNWGHIDASFFDNSGGIIRNNSIRGKIGWKNSYDADYNGPAFEGSKIGISLCNSVNVKVFNNSVYNPSNYNDDRVRSLDLQGWKVQGCEFSNNLLLRKPRIIGGTISYNNAWSNNFWDATSACNYSSNQLLSMFNNANGIVPDLHLTSAASSAINAGTNLTAWPNDLDNQVSADGMRDIGADERNSVVNSTPCAATTNTNFAALNPAAFTTLFSASPSKTGTI